MSVKQIVCSTGYIEIIERGRQGAKGDMGDNTPGGLTGEVLAKASDADYDTEWVSPSGAVTTEGYLTVKKNGEWVDSILYEEDGVVKSSAPIHADVVAPTGSIYFENSAKISSNSESLEINQIVRDTKAEITVAQYNDAGSSVPVYSQKDPIVDSYAQVLEDTSNGDFSAQLTATANYHITGFLVKPEVSGTGSMTIRDIDGNGVILNSATSIDIGILNVTGEWVLIELSNPIKVFAGQTIWVRYEGPALLGHNFVDDPIWGTAFVPAQKIRRHEFFQKNMALEENQITQAERDKIAGMTDGRFLGVFADLATLNTAYPTASEGDSATVVDPSNNLFYYDDVLGSWEDTGTGSAGDMNSGMYDPQSVAGDAFSMDNMVEGLNTMIMNASERLQIADNSVKFSFPEAPIDGTCYLRQDATWVQPPVSRDQSLELTSGGESDLHYHDADRDRANHTGMQDHSTITDFHVGVDATPSVILNTAKLTYPNDDKLKLAGIEVGAEVNPIDSEIKTQYENNADTNPFTDVERAKLAGIEDGAQQNYSRTTRSGHTWTISGEVEVALGDVDFINAFFVSMASGQSLSIVKAVYKINSGTSCNVKIQNNGVDVPGFTNLEVTTTKQSVDPLAIELDDEDQLSLVVNSVTGVPTNMSFTLFIESTA